MTKLVILDRDGVINEDRDDFVKSVDEWVALPGSMDAALPARMRLRPCATKMRLLWSSFTTSATVPKAT